MSDLDTTKVEELIRAAREVREQAYAPHSSFHVGAALLTDGDDVFVGCNVENASYSLSICAERVAASTSIVNGHLRWKALALATAGGVTPCGACRQFLAEFGIDLPIYIFDTETNQQQQTNLAVLLPQAFSPDDLERLKG